jgi:hypothetical protein
MPKERLCNVQGELARRRLVVRPLRHNGGGDERTRIGEPFLLQLGAS